MQGTDNTEFLYKISSVHYKGSDRFLKTGKCRGAVILFGWTTEIDDVTSTIDKNNVLLQKIFH